MNITKKLVEEKNWSKYRIAKRLDVSWVSVQFWFKEVFQPNAIHQQQLYKLWEESNHLHSRLDGERNAGEDTNQSL